MAILFLNGTVIDGNGGVTERGALLTTNGTIEAVGNSDNLEAHRTDPDTTVIDLAGRTLMPGLIDSHVHLAGGDFAPNREGDPLGLAAFRTVGAAARTLQAGFTTIRVAGSRDYLDVDLRDAIAEGSLVGPRILASGRGLTTTGGHYYNW
jgi:imidazolonepropionase-like amidohydrolase